MTTNHKPATALPPTARLKQIGYMLDHPGSFGEVSAYLAQLEHKNQRLVAFLGGIDAVDHNLYTRAQTILRELGEL